MEEYLPIIFKVVGIGLGLGLTWLVGMVIAKFKFSKKEAEAIKALQAGVTNTYNNYVRDAKLGAKMTPDQKKKARQLAIEHATGLLKGPALKFFLAMWSSRKEQIIESVISKFKKDAK